MQISDFESTTPVYRPEEFLVGQLEGWGILERLTGPLQNRFTVTAQGTREAAWQSLRFVETWTFDDGHVDTLSWTITKTAEGAYTGDEPNLVGAAKGDAAGCAYHWRYTRDTPQKDGKTLKLDFSDRFFRINDPGRSLRHGARLLSEGRLDEGGRPQPLRAHPVLRRHRPVQSQDLPLHRLPVDEWLGLRRQLREISAESANVGILPDEPGSSVASG